MCRSQVQSNSSSSKRRLSCGTCCQRCWGWKGLTVVQGCSGQVPEIKTYSSYQTGHILSCKELGVRKRKYCTCLSFFYSKQVNAGERWLTGLEEPWLNMTVLLWKHTCAEAFTIKTKKPKPNLFIFSSTDFCSITFTFTSHIWTSISSYIFLNKERYSKRICLNFEFFNSVHNSAGGKKSLHTSCDTHQHSFQTRRTE